MGESLGHDALQERGGEGARDSAEDLYGEVMHLTMPAGHKVLSRLQQARKPDHEQNYDQAMLGVAQANAPPIRAKARARSRSADALVTGRSVMGQGVKTATATNSSHAIQRKTTDMVGRIADLGARCSCAILSRPVVLYRTVLRRNCPIWTRMGQ